MPGAADHRQRAEAALVAVARARLEAGPEIIDGEQGTREAVKTQSEVDDADLAAVVRPVQRV
jgi:Cu/Ag efflux pump CusA